MGHAPSQNLDLQVEKHTTRTSQFHGQASQMAPASSTSHHKANFTHPIWFPHWPAWMCTISLILPGRYVLGRGGGCAWKRALQKAFD